MKEQRCYIDVGGGTIPDFFLHRAKLDRQSQYLVLDPTIKKVTNKPNNLHLIRWQSDDYSSLPLRQSSADGIFLNNIFDELRTDGEGLDWSNTERIFDSGYHESTEILDSFRQKELYTNILRASRKVLKKSGLLVITEPSENIFMTLKLCLRQNYRIVSSPKVVSNPRKSIWTKWFYDIYSELEQHEGKYDAVPTEFAVRL